MPRRTSGVARGSRRAVDRRDDVSDAPHAHGRSPRRVARIWTEKERPYVAMSGSSDEPSSIPTILRRGLPAPTGSISAVARGALLGRCVGVSGDAWIAFRPRDGRSRCRAARPGGTAAAHMRTDLIDAGRLGVGHGETSEARETCTGGG